MPACPFVGPELDQDRLMIDIFDPNKGSFIDKVQQFVDSKYSSALFAQVETDTIPESDTRKYQSFLNKLIKANGFTDYKIICFNPEDSITNIDGFNPRQFVPAFLINIANKKELGRAHRIIMKSKYFDKMSDAYKKYLKI
tara:strand:- start:308 stop:727 length:420 start_codon:yes stop_codon:yes gene_type:complete